MFARPYLNPYIIAEIGIHHYGSVVKAMRLVDAAAAGGAHAIKLQHYTADKLVHPTATAFWDTTYPNGEAVENQLDLYSNHKMLNATQMAELRDHCKFKNIDLLATGFSIADVDFVDPFISAHKVASCDITNIPLLEHIGSKLKPVVLSTGGASTFEEIREAIHAIYTGAGCIHAVEIALLHCNLEYPTPIHHAGLIRIKDLIREFQNDKGFYPVGYSDHTLRTTEALEIATGLGAQVLETHFTVTPKAKGADHYHAATTASFLKFQAWRDKVNHYLPYGYDQSHQQPAREQARRCIVAARPITKGDVFTKDNLTTLRPATLGLPANAWHNVLGTKAEHDFAVNEPISIAKYEPVDYSVRRHCTNSRFDIITTRK